MIVYLKCKTKRAKLLFHWDNFVGLKCQLKVSKNYEWGVLRTPKLDKNVKMQVTLKTIIATELYYNY